MPAPTMMTSSSMDSPRQASEARSSGIQAIGKPTVNLAELWSFDEAHANARGVAGDLTGKPLCAGPVEKTPVVFSAFRRHPQAMRAPPIAVDGAGEFAAAAQLRA